MFFTKGKNSIEKVLTSMENCGIIKVLNYFLGGFRLCFTKESTCYKMT